MNIISYNGTQKVLDSSSELELLLIGRDLRNKGVWTLSYVTKKKITSPSMFSPGRKVIGHPGLIVQPHGSAHTDLQLELGCEGAFPDLTALCLL